MASVRHLSLEEVISGAGDRLTKPPCWGPAAGDPCRTRQLRREDASAGLEVPLRLRPGRGVLVPGSLRVGSQEEARPPLAGRPV